MSKGRALPFLRSSPTPGCPQHHHYPLWPPHTLPFSISSSAPSSPPPAPIPPLPTVPQTTPPPTPLTPLPLLPPPIPTLLGLHPFPDSLIITASKPARQVPGTQPCPQAAEEVEQGTPSCWQPENTNYLCSPLACPASPASPAQWPWGGEGEQGRMPWTRTRGPDPVSSPSSPGTSQPRAPSLLGADKPEAFCQTRQTHGFTCDFHIGHITWLKGVKL